VVTTPQLSAVRDADPEAKWEVVTPSTGSGSLLFLTAGRALERRERLLTVWDITGRPAVLARREDRTAHPYSVGAHRASPDGRQFAFTISDEGVHTELRVWETATLTEVYRLVPDGGLTGFAFTPDGRRLVVGHPDTTLTVWDLDAVERRALSPITGDPWDQLASPDPKVGLAAVRQLAADPATALTLFRKRFAVPEPVELRRLIADLDDPRFPVRDAASKELAAAADAAEPALRKAVETSGSAEVRERVRRILRRFESVDGRLPTAHLRAVRAVEVLERIGTPGARAVLVEWVATARLTERGKQAKATLDRLAAGE
jgi:hypothetical protein